LSIKFVFIQLIHKTQNQLTGQSTLKEELQICLLFGISQPEIMLPACRSKAHRWSQKWVSNNIET